MQHDLVIEVFLVADIDTFAEESLEAALTVVAEKQGWYEVHLPDDAAQTAFIKQSLCTDKATEKNDGKDRGQGNKADRPKRQQRDDGTSTPDTQEPAQLPATTPAPAEEEVVEEVTSGSESLEEILY